MPRNVEIKARVRDFAALERRVRELARRHGNSRGSGEPEVLHQDDTFFGISDGRLKLRRISSEGTGEGREGREIRAELIFYRRPDAAGPKTSHYRKVDVGDAEGLRALLTEALGVTGRVVKTRQVWILDRTRVHLDQVERLGEFLELEVVLRDEETEAEGAALARELMAELGISKEDLVEGAYLDLHLDLHLDLREPGGTGSTGVRR